MSLRQFRFKKDNVVNSSSTTDGGGGGGAGGESTTLKLVPGRKRIHRPADSSSDEGHSPKGSKGSGVAGGVTGDGNNADQNPGSNLTVKEKEILLCAVRMAEPEYDTMICQDALFHNNWNKEEAIKYLKEHCANKRRKIVPNNYRIVSPMNGSSSAGNGGQIVSPTSSQQNGGNINTTMPNQQVVTTSPPNIQKFSHSSSGGGGGHGGGGGAGHQKSKSKRKRRESEKSDSNEEDRDDFASRPKERVYNSDDEDSEEEQQYHSCVMTKDRKRVFEFMNTAKTNEFQSVKTCSQKKVDAIMELRPFNSWSEMLEKISAHRSVSNDILNHCQDFLIRRNNMVRIMKKCTQMVARLEAAFDIGGGIKNQPTILNNQFKLADYQLIGLNWLVVMHNEKMNGILADEMGLGKTIQVISFLAYLKENGLSHGTHLIVVPSSTLENWSQEFSRWCPDMVVEKYYGSMDERRSMRIRFAKGGLSNIDVLLTTYHTVGSTSEERKMFRITKMHYVVFDEAHMLKNMTTQRYSNLFGICAERRLLLTGTPLQNNLLELMSLLCFVMPSLFSNNTEDIKSLFSKNIKLKDEDEVSSFEQTQIEQAKRIMRPFVLRRLKDDVLNSLPPKTDVTVKVPMTPYQKEIYEELVHSHSSEFGVVRASSEQSIMSIMMEMRKLSNHPLLMRYYYTDDKVRIIAKKLSGHSLYKKNPNPQYIFEDLAILSDFQLQQTIEKYNIQNMNIPDEMILNSGKFVELDKLLPRLRSEGHRVLIFSQLTMILDILERYLDISNYGFLRLDGQTAVTERQDLIDKYMTDSDIFIFLLSTRAGGLGINLTAADTVILHDIDFNPYNDKQAEDRCHRMGQKKPVTIYRLISQGTIEEPMRMVALSKLNLEREVTNEKDNTIKEHKCMVRILSMALGVDSEQCEKILSPEMVKKSAASSVEEEEQQQVATSTRKIKLDDAGDGDGDD